MLHPVHVSPNRARPVFGNRRQLDAQLSFVFTALPGLSLVEFGHLDTQLVEVVESEAEHVAVLRHAQRPEAARKDVLENFSFFL